MSATDDLTTADIIKRQAKVIMRLRNSLREIATEADGHLAWCKEKGYNEPRTSVHVSHIANDALVYLDIQSAKMEAKRRGELDKEQARLSG